MLASLKPETDMLTLAVEIPKLLHNEERMKLDWDPLSSKIRTGCRLPIESVIWAVQVRNNEKVSLEQKAEIVV